MKAFVISDNTEIDVLHVSIHHSNGTKETYYTSTGGSSKKYYKEEIIILNDYIKWTEITKNNVEDIYRLSDNGYPIIIGTKHREYNDNFDIMEEIITYQMNNSLSFNTMAKFGGYYCIVLPKLK